MSVAVALDVQGEASSLEAQFSAAIAAALPAMAGQRRTTLAMIVALNDVIDEFIASRCGVREIVAQLNAALRKIGLSVTENSFRIYRNRANALDGSSLRERMIARGRPVTGVRGAPVRTASAPSYASVPSRTLMGELRAAARSMHQSLMSALSFIGLARPSPDRSSLPARMDWGSPDVLSQTAVSLRSSVDAAVPVRLPVVTSPTVPDVPSSSAPFVSPVVVPALPAVSADRPMRSEREPSSSYHRASPEQEAAIEREKERIEKITALAMGREPGVKVPLQMSPALAALLAGNGRPVPAQQPSETDGS